MRRFLALLSLIALLSLALVLFHRVWLHHQESMRFQREREVITSVDRDSVVIFAPLLW